MSTAYNDSIYFSVNKIDHKRTFGMEIPKSVMQFSNFYHTLSLAGRVENLFFLQGKRFKLFLHLKDINFSQRSSFFFFFFKVQFQILL